MQEKKSFMSLFNRRPPSATPPKVMKKVKPNRKFMLHNVRGQDEEDPLFKILSWRDEITEIPVPPPDTFRYEESPSIVKDDQSKWGEDFQAIFMNICWSRVGFDQFKELELKEEVINNGIVFIWGENNKLGDIIRYFNSQGFQFVESFMFGMLDRNKIPSKKKVSSTQNTLFNYITKSAEKNNQTTEPAERVDYETGRVDHAQEIFMNKDSEYFQQAQMVLYMFRKPNKTRPLELRHQRTSDAFFTIEDDMKLTEKSMEAVYKMIETLLIKANYQKGKPLQLLELWGEKESKRKGWVTVHENRE